MKVKAYRSYGSGWVEDGKLVVLVEPHSELWKRVSHTKHILPDSNVYWDGEHTWYLEDDEIRLEWEGELGDIEWKN